MLGIWVTEKVHPELESELVSMGFQLFMTKPIDEQNQLNTVGIIVRNQELKAEEIELFPNLKFIARAGVGMENIDLQYAEANHIKCFNAGEANAQAVAEHALGHLLSLIRNIVKADSEVRKGIWLREENRGRQLSGLKVGIIGWGNTGSAFGDLVSKLGCKVMAFDKYKSGFGNEQVEEVTEMDLKNRSDLISLHVPLTKETNGYFNEDWFSSIANPIWLLNTSRGAILDLNVVKKLIENNKLRGVALDVLPEEDPTKWNDPVYHWLMNSQKVVFSPHIAGWTNESYEKISEVLIYKIKGMI